MPEIVGPVQVSQRAGAFLVTPSIVLSDKGVYSRNAYGEVSVAETASIAEGGPHVTRTLPRLYAHFSAGGEFACGIRVDGAVECLDEHHRPIEVSFPAGRMTEVVTLGGRTPVWAGDRCPTGISDADVVEALLNPRQVRCSWCATDAGGHLSCVPRLGVPRGSFHGLVVGWPVKCALDAQNHAVCWSRGDASFEGPLSSRLSVPKGEFVQLSVGVAQTCGLRPNGMVQCWQSEPTELDPDDCASPVACGIQSPGAIRFNQISSGDRHNCGITRAGTLHCWGDARDGRLAAPSGRFIQVASASGYSCATRTEGVIACWGDLTRQRPSKDALEKRQRLILRLQQGASPGQRLRSVR